MTINSRSAAGASRRTRKRSLPPDEFERSSSPIFELVTPNNSPKKRRKFQQDGLEDDLSDKLSQIKVNHRPPLSPTVSDFEVAVNRLPLSSASGSRTLLASDHDEDSESDSESALEDFVYEIDEEEVDESDEEEIEGETPLDEDEKESGDIPVRVLDDFTIYELETMVAIPLARLLELPHPSTTFSASGLVGPWVEEDSEDEEDSDDEESEDSRGRILLDPKRDRLSLSKIVEFSIHYPSDTKGELDGKIYIKTRHAWYILGNPSDDYRSFYSLFWVKHRIVHLLVAASNKNVSLSWDNFKENIQEIDDSEEVVVPSHDILGRPMSEKDVDSDETYAYLISTLQDLIERKVVSISRVPAIREILGPFHYNMDIDISPRKVEASPKRKASRTSRTSTGKGSSLRSKKIKVKPGDMTFLTPIVNRIAKELFKGSLEVARSLHYIAEKDIASIRHLDHKGHQHNPKNVDWGEHIDSLYGKEIYRSVVVDGTEYRIGDTVMVEPDMEYNSKKYDLSQQTVNKYGNRWWFCQIRYFYQDGKRGPKMFHGQWFVHGSKTILQETSHSRALYLLKKSCNDNEISSIFKKCNLTVMRPGFEEVPDDGSLEHPNGFHCSLLYDEDLSSFEDLPPEALGVDLEESTHFCYSCELKEKDEEEPVQVPEDVDIDDEVIVHGETYHVHDLVYLYPSGKSKLLDIGQITEVTLVDNEISVGIRQLDRYDDYVKQRRKQRAEGHENDTDLVSDERLLIFTDKVKIIPAHKLEGKCQVRHLTKPQLIEEWVQHDDHFYLNEMGHVNAKGETVLEPMDKQNFGYCKECRDNDTAVRNEKDRFHRTNSKLVGMELFSGAGGLGVGMDLSDFVETKYAVEYEPSAAKTYQTNHPHTAVYCQDSSKLLKHAVACMNGENPKPLLSNDGKTFCPAMPEKGDHIDFIFGGPPCQSFSRANHSKRADDIRSTMPCSMLSYVEHYEPDYFLLENVAGFLDHKFLMHDDSDGQPTEIKFGMVKLVTRTLIALGYQVRYRLLQSGQYGVPQTRRRVIFWGAKRGLPLPEFPLPVYAFDLAAYRVSLPDGNYLAPLSRSRDAERPHQCAPLRPITVRDAIGDLEPFEWQNPHLLVRATPSDRESARHRQHDLHIAQFDADTRNGDRDFFKLPGFPRGAEYVAEPQNRFQKWLRRGDDDDDAGDRKVTGHYTTRWKSLIVEATANVPLKALADHRDLHVTFLPPRAKAKSSSNKLVLYGRLDPDSYFRCAVTSLSPVCKNQWPLHPWLKRVISVREAARAQGFPDSYVFQSVNKDAQSIVKDQLRQIGNAVSVPFALALGKELGKAMIKAWKKKEREGSVCIS